MLYDKEKWEGPKTEVYSVAGLIQWLEKKDPATEYKWCNAGICLYGQYLHESLGRECTLKEWNQFLDTGVGCAGVALSLPHTFGAALERARKLV